MDVKNLIAIDTHTHLEVSCRNPFDNYGAEYDRAADKYFRSSKRPTMDESLAYYREKKIGFVMFTVDAETQMGRRRIPNEEIAEAAMANSDIMIAFPQLVRFQQMPKLADRRLIRDRLATQINAHKLPHGARVIQRFLHGRIREIEPLLQTVEA